MFLKPVWEDTGFKNIFNSNGEGQIIPTTTTTGSPNIFTFRITDDDKQFNCGNALPFWNSAAGLF